MIFLTTTALEVDEELLNRCLVLTVDEGTAQTQAIHDRQREGRTLEGLLGRAVRSDLIRKHQNAQRLLEKLVVVNPLAKQLTFSSHRTRSRRDHLKYLTLIDAVALLHQHQREKKEAQRGPARLRYIEVTEADVAMANRLAAPLLGRTLDELAPQTRHVLEGLIELVRLECVAQGILPSEYRFTRRAVRERLGVSDTRLRAHLERLVELEYLTVHRGARGLSFVYELIYLPPERAGDGALEADVLTAAPRAAPKNGHAPAAASWSARTVAGEKPLPN